jgi:ribosome biogenesis GTPase
MPEQIAGARGRRARADRRRIGKVQRQLKDGSSSDRNADLSGDEIESEESLTPHAASGGYATPDGRRDLPDADEITTRVGLVAGIQRGGEIQVLLDARLYAGRLARELARGTPALAVGDRVHVRADGDDRGTIVGVEPRRTRLARIREDRSRRSPFSREEAVLAANVDVAVIVAAVAQPPFHPKLVDRFLVICQYGGIGPVLCLNKCDLGQVPPDLSAYEEIGLPIVYASAATGAGLDRLRNLLQGRIAVFTGHSGVGKSSLVNALLQEDRQVIGTVRAADGRGRHTTTSSSLLRLDDDSYLVDTPGVRSLGIWKIDPQTLSSYFPDFDPFSRFCRFTTCSHTHEPGCAVKDAAEAGEIRRQRYESYLRLTDG